MAPARGEFEAERQAFGALRQAESLKTTTRDEVRHGQKHHVHVRKTSANVRFCPRPPAPCGRPAGVRAVLPTTARLPRPAAPSANVREMSAWPKYPRAADVSRTFADKFYPFLEDSRPLRAAADIHRTSPGVYRPRTKTDIRGRFADTGFLARQTTLATRLRKKKKKNLSCCVAYKAPLRKPWEREAARKSPLFSSCRPGLSSKQSNAHGLRAASAVDSSTCQSLCASPSPQRPPCTESV